NAHNFPLDLA
nr:Chain B, PHE-PRO-LEU-ASP-LEU-ALA [Thermosynechococcus vestitus]